MNFVLRCFLSPVAALVKVNITLRYPTDLLGEVSTAVTETVCHIQCLQRPHCLAVVIFFSPHQELSGNG
jgi:predicted transcriptional regulator